MKELLEFLRWPVVCGLLAAIIILDHFPDLLGINNANDTRSVSSQGPYSYAQAVQQAAPAVVNIHTRKTVKQKLPALYNDPILRYLLQKNIIRQKERVQNSLGSGIIINPNGYILTNNHVIKDADKILVLLQDGREALAKVIGIDRETDLAVLKIDLNELETITIGDPSQAMVGDVVLAIGNPYGFGHTVTQGIISATGRHGLELTTYENFIQTDAAINPGNSGGALVDARGRLLGISTAIQSNSGGSQGIGLATPSDLAIRIMSDIIEYGKVIRGWLGVNVEPIPAATAQSYNLPVNNGIIIMDIHRGGPADNSGLIKGDIITGINNQPVGNGQAAMNFIAATRPGEEVVIDLVREGQTMSISAVVGNKEDATE
ncbi:trypsin-like peptidase domain-containing protein [uncultured Oceanicoccus sp.]|uniref:S1C family serine protease n=1 Tax=uncultured Oceanicoccus sp. TaxID=1706381 RepID=UPI0030DB7440